ncbi:protein-L-histidine N-pros-methyltransferase isoform X2 [Cylas formicarius]|uniref:protein-L-histidine N-pros-methyltransferase isoform X2 n=1 Tax=Cylas formicarius TaxID=197179 RepID=UPI0029586EDD|nr:protein-L-histidine N-pros-methyltransferase isoform X2 [Cylas formicarius]
MRFFQTLKKLGIEWYQCDLNSLPPAIASKFVQLGPDNDTIKFLEESEKKSDWILTQIWHTIVKAVLGWFMTQTSINGWLRRGSMFVLSQPQLLKLLHADDEWRADSLLDLGAGDGEVTARLAPLFRNVYVTEVSDTMRSLLDQKGYRVLDVDAWFLDRKFDFVACLNVIDRCDTPLQLLSRIRESLKSDGFLLLAVVLPFSAYVESGAPDHKPRELLPIDGERFEDQVISVVEEVLKPAGFDVTAWSRVPYLCEGDLHQSYYWLDDVVFVLRLSNAR